MTRDPEKHSECADQIDVVESNAFEDEAVEEEEEPAVPERPTCPRCGWHNTRPSHTKNILDSCLRMFSLRPYRCRSCGNRFHIFRRTVPS